MISSVLSKCVCLISSIDIWTGVAIYSIRLIYSFRLFMEYINILGHVQSLGSIKKNQKHFVFVHTYTTHTNTAAKLLATVIRYSELCKE